ncbi:MAG TPA: sigma-70 family RNA polymerase sigma factor, partial [Labilithrix sp.]|nr:sigma-70 family RNA polymerase sigma factor [Labilithrix sp.]
PARGLRLHPRAVRLVTSELGEALARQPRNTRLKRALAAIDVARREGERVTADLVQSNLRIVVTFARRYRGMPLVDLIQEGNLGLMRAVDKFDHRRGLRFSTYAAWWIRHALSRALADQSKMIRLPVHLTGAVQRVKRAQDRLQRETGHDASPEELASRTGLPIEQVRRALDVVAQPVSLDSPMSGPGGEREGSDLVDFVTDHEATPADEVVAQGQLRIETSALLSELPEREAEIIRMRFGLGGGAQRTLEEIGLRLSLSRERARQLERDALKKLRVASEKRRLRAHLGG